MHVVDTISEAREWVGHAREDGRRVCLVPTMGALHDGHLSLVDIARAHADVVVLSVFVNPTQFTDSDDFDHYPRNLAADLAAAERAGVDLVFAPSVSEMYPECGAEQADSTIRSRVLAGHGSEQFEGAHRPGHFDGVVTVVSALFHIIRPDSAVFGEKDFQQLHVVRQLVDDLHLAVQIIAAPIVREPDGLALSSRNVRLSPAARQDALALSRALFQIRDSFLAGERDAAALTARALAQLEIVPTLQLDYLAIVDAASFEAVQRVEQPCRALIAATIDGVRLIDNIGLV